MHILPNHFVVRTVSASWAKNLEEKLLESRRQHFFFKNIVSVVFFAIAKAKMNENETLKMKEKHIFPCPCEHASGTFLHSFFSESLCFCLQFTCATHTVAELQNIAPSRNKHVFCSGFMFPILWCAKFVSFTLAHLVESCGIQNIELRQRRNSCPVNSCIICFCIGFDTFFLETSLHTDMFTNNEIRTVGGSVLPKCLAVAYVHQKKGQRC